MAWFKHKPDPLSDRARELTEQIAALEARIKQLDGNGHRETATPRFRSTTLPGGETSHRLGPQSPALPQPVAEPVFEPVDQNRLKTLGEDPAASHHANPLGVRKYGLQALWQRLRNHFRGPATTNPKLVSYLAAGGIQGLRPLRYEKRIARNRFIALAVFLLAMLFGIVVMVMRRR